MVISNFIKLLKITGVQNVCISPGLRNTAISLPFINNRFHCYSILDERASAYLALGMALKTKTASVLICTSGTATANYLPAIIEASQSKIPLIIITADRPKESLNNGENQTINQKNIYGNFVRSSLSFNENDDTINKIQDSLKFIDMKNSGTTIGPIHFNIHLPDFNLKHKIKTNETPLNNTSQIPKKNDFNWNNFAYKDVFNIHNYQKPLIIIGRLNRTLDCKLLAKFSDHLNAPILTDSLSQIRFSNLKSLNLYEHYINHDDIKPDLIIRIGQKPVSKKLSKKITKLENDGVNNLNFSSLLIDDSGRFNDNAPTIIKKNYKDFIQFIINNTVANKNNIFYKKMYQLENHVSEIINDENDWSEFSIAKASLLSIKNNENFVIGNSMPIRYIDMLWNLTINHHINMYSNRGASGIDGVIATSLGIASKSKYQTTLLIGDLSFIYDQSSLMLAKQLKINLIIIIINNNGGGIFSLLPVSKDVNKKIFTKYWTTPQNIDIKNIADLYNCNYNKVQTMKDLYKSLTHARKNNGINIIDSQIDINIKKKIINKINGRIKKGIA